MSARVLRNLAGLRLPMTSFGASVAGPFISELRLKEGDMVSRSEQVNEMYLSTRHKR